MKAEYFTKYHSYKLEKYVVIEDVHTINYITFGIFFVWIMVSPHIVNLFQDSSPGICIYESHFNRKCYFCFYNEYNCSINYVINRLYGWNQ